MNEENQPIQKSTISLKIFPAPTQEQVEFYTDKKKRLLKIGGYATGTFILLLLFIFSLLAIISVKNYSLFNISILIVLIGLTSFLTYKFTYSLDKGVELVNGNVTEVRDVTNTYESITVDEKGLKIKLELFYNFTDVKNNNHKASFVILIDKDKLDEMKSEIPDAGNDIPVIYDHKKSKVLDIFIPTLRPYIDHY